MTAFGFFQSMVVWAHLFMITKGASSSYLIANSS